MIAALFVTRKKSLVCQQIENLRGARGANAGQPRGLGDGDRQPRHVEKFAPETQGIEIDRFSGSDHDCTQPTLPSCHHPDPFGAARFAVLDRRSQQRLQARLVVVADDRTP